MARDLARSIIALMCAAGLGLTLAACSPDVGSEDWCDDM